MLSNESIEILLNNAKELSIVQHESIIDKIDNIINKVDILEKKFDIKITELEHSSIEFQTWKNYIIAFIVIIGFITPVLGQYLFK